MYVSVTGFRLHSPLLGPWFWAHAVPSMAQARTAPGNLFAAARVVDGVHHTLTAWTDRAAMQAYVRNGAHQKAVRRFPHLGRGRTCGFDAQALPDWSEALAIWHRTSRDVSGEELLPK